MDTLNWLLEKARGLGADAADCVLFETTDVSTSWRLGKPEGLERSENQAVGLRAFVGAQQAIVSATDMLPDSLLELAERAVAMAKAAPADPDSKLADPSLYARHIPELELYDNNEPSLSWLTEQCKIAEETALGVGGITNSEGADAQYSQSRISLAISHGQRVDFAESYETSHFSFSLSVLAGSGTGMERDYDFSSSRFRSDLQPAAAIGLSAAQRALKRMNPRKVSTCRVPVIFDPRVGRSLLGIVSSAISGAAIARGSSFLKDAMGQSLFPPGVTIIDDPHRLRGFGSKPFDAEGVKNSKQTLVDKGVLQSWLLDVRTGNKLGLCTNGHATRGIASPPSPSTTNIYMENGSITPEALIKETGSGFYVTETFGMGINIVTGDYSQGASGFWIEKGEIAYPVSEITIAGNLRDMFKNLTPANDLTFRYGSDVPTVRVETMTLAGT